MPNFKYSEVDVATTIFIYNENGTKKIVEDDTQFSTQANSLPISQMSVIGATEMNVADFTAYINNRNDWENSIPGSRPPSKPEA